MAGIPYSDRRLYTKAGSKRKTSRKKFSHAQRAAYWKKKYLSLLKSRSR